MLVVHTLSLPKDECNREELPWNHNKITECFCFNILLHIYQNTKLTYRLCCFDQSPPLQFWYHSCNKFGIEIHIFYFYIWCLMMTKEHTVCIKKRFLRTSWIIQELAKWYENFVFIISARSRWKTKKLADNWKQITITRKIWNWFRIAGDTFY